jgi:transketolase
MRPGDANETAVAWRVALATREQPVALVLTRQSVPTLYRAQFSAADGLQRGGYILADAPNGNPDLILIASDSEVALIVAARQKLLEKKLPVRIGPRRGCDARIWLHRRQRMQAGRCPPGNGWQSA